MTCDLCDQAGGDVVWRDDRLRVVRVADADYPGFCRVVWSRHVKEMSDLSPAERHHLMSVVFGVEGVLRALLKPEKINLASLGNLTPHLHWHVIPRFRDDRHFPQPIWGLPERAAKPRAGIEFVLARLPQALALRFAYPDSRGVS